MFVFAAKSWRGMGGGYSVSVVHVVVLPMDWSPGERGSLTVQDQTRQTKQHNQRTSTKAKTKQGGFLKLKKHNGAQSYPVLGTRSAHVTVQLPDHAARDGRHDPCFVAPVYAIKGVRQWRQSTRSKASLAEWAGP